MTQSKIIVRNLSKSFDERVVLQDINFAVEAGKSLVIIGGSGSGKSVLIKCIIGLLAPDTGSQIMIDNSEVTFLHVKNRDLLSEKCSMLFQGCALFDGLPIWHNVSFRYVNAGQLNTKDARNLSAEKLAMVGLGPEILDLYPAQISGGMQKRVALARAIASAPDIIFFDEPTSGLDPINGSAISALIATLSKKLNATTITITHDMSCMRQIADHVIMLHNGGIAWSGAFKDIEHADNAYLTTFIHASKF